MRPDPIVTPVREATRATRIEPYPDLPPDVRRALRAMSGHTPKEALDWLAASYRDCQDADSAPEDPQCKQR